MSNYKAWLQYIQDVLKEDFENEENKEKFIDSLRNLVEFALDNKECPYRRENEDIIIELDNDVLNMLCLMAREKKIEISDYMEQIIVSEMKKPVELEIKEIHDYLS